MQKIIRGVQHFRTEIFQRKHKLYSKLRTGQNPEAMFITCSDSRIVPSALTETDAGDLFVLRNAGNMVPRFGTSAGGEGASLEFAVCGLKIPDIIVCGHTDCGAIRYLMQKSGAELPLVRGWVNGASELVENSKSTRSSEAERLESAYRQNILLQIRNLLSYPFISEAVRKGELTLHGWLFDLGSGEILNCDFISETFVAFSPSTRKAGGE